MCPLPPTPNKILPLSAYYIVMFYLTPKKRIGQSISGQCIVTRKSIDFWWWHALLCVCHRVLSEVHTKVGFSVHQIHSLQLVIINGDGDQATNQMGEDKKIQRLSSISYMWWGRGFRYWALYNKYKSVIDLFIGDQFVNQTLIINCLPFRNRKQIGMALAEGH